jgi:hypothetical protein
MGASVRAATLTEVLPEAGRAQVRADVFFHLAGVALVPTVTALAARGVPQRFCDSDRPLLIDGATLDTHVNEGYLRVAMRLLVAAGWLTEVPTDTPGVPAYQATARGRLALRAAPPLFEQVSSFLPHAIRISDALFTEGDSGALPWLRHFARRARQRWRIDSAIEHPQVADQIRRYLDGVLIAPVIVALGRAGVLTRLTEGPVDLEALGGNTATLSCAFDLLAGQGWVIPSADRVALTPEGRYAAQIAASYGVTVSYLPTFTQLPALIFGNADVPRVDEHGDEALVDRAMNVWGSGGAHKTYFRRLDEIVVDIFNRPIDQQPLGICDMGCGDGTLLAHLYATVCERTLRGTLLDTHPLVIVGADFNKVARRETGRTLRRARIPNHHVIAGDINRPAFLASELEKRGIDSHELLHVRSFLDHNRPYTGLADYRPHSRMAASSGAFAHRGRLIAPDALEENLVRHLRRWAPYAARFGLLVLELHTIPPSLTAANLDRTPAIAYDATHGYSDQYLVEVPVFLACAREAGLHADARFHARFPASELATVTINFFTARSGADAQRPDPGRSASQEE